MKKLLFCSVLIAFMLSVGVGYGSNSAPNQNTDCKIAKTEIQNYVAQTVQTDVQDVTAEVSTLQIAPQASFVMLYAEITSSPRVISIYKTRNCDTYKSDTKPPGWESTANYLSCNTIQSFKNKQSFKKLSKETS